MSEQVRKFIGLTPPEDGSWLFKAARRKDSGHEFPVYDDGFGKLYIMRDSMGISGVVRAQSWEDAYGICKDEFFPEADETVDELVREYGFRVEYKKVIHCEAGLPDCVRHPELGEFEKFAEEGDYVDGRLPDGKFIRWASVSTPDAEAWMEHPVFQEGYGFRPNGRNAKDKHGHGIYQKDLSGEALDRLRERLAEELGIEIEWEEWQ